MTSCHLIMDPPADGPWNMAVDESLLEWSAGEGSCCWRFYGWREPTLSLGYFQTAGDRQRHPASLPCPLVRRPSGGGAILHDHELTYSLVLPADHLLAQKPRTFYEAVHGALVAALIRLGVQTAMLPEVALTAPDRQPFLCFERRTRGDVLLGEAKVAGSAQRRLPKAVLQHGSVLLARSAAAPELPGLNDAGPTAVTVDDLAAAWLDVLAVRLGLSWRPATLSADQRQRAEALVAAKYGSDLWTIDRGRPPHPAH